nr:MAG TPA: hypothetical protein [Caudoviricetes sp.]
MFLLSHICPDSGDVLYSGELQSLRFFENSDIILLGYL